MKKDRSLQNVCFQNSITDWADFQETAFRGKLAKKSDSEEKYSVIASIVDTLHRMVFSQEIKLSQSQAFSLLPGKQFISHWKQPKKFTGARKRQKRREFMCFTCSRFYGLLVIGKIFLSLNLHVLIKSGILKALKFKMYMNDLEKKQL